MMIITYLCDTSMCLDVCNSHIVDDIRWYNWHVYRSFRDNQVCIYIPLVCRNIRFSSDNQEVVNSLCSFLLSTQDDIFEKEKKYIIRLNYLQLYTLTYMNLWAIWVITSTWILTRTLQERYNDHVHIQVYTLLYIQNGQNYNRRPKILITINVSYQFQGFENNIRLSQSIPVYPG